MVPTMKANVYKVQKVQTTLGVFTQKQPIVTNTSAIKLQGGCQSSTTPSEPEDLSEINTTATNNTVEDEPEPTSVAIPQVNFEYYQQMEGDVKTEQNEILGHSNFVAPLANDFQTEKRNGQLLSLKLEPLGCNTTASSWWQTSDNPGDYIKFEKINDDDDEITVSIDNSLLNLRQEIYPQKVESLPQKRKRLQRDQRKAQERQSYMSLYGDDDLPPPKQSLRPTVQNQYSPDFIYSIERDSHLTGLKITGPGLAKFGADEMTAFRKKILIDFGFQSDYSKPRYPSYRYTLSFYPAQKESNNADDYPRLSLE